MTADSKGVHIVTYGCSANQNDSQIMTGLLKKAGYRIVSMDKARYVIINSCGVKSPTEEKIIRKLARLSGTDKKVIVAGCLTKISQKRIRRAIPNFSAMLDPRSVDKIADIFFDIDNGKKGIVVSSESSPNKAVLPTVLPNPVVGILQVSEGCLSSCAFCATKMARGELTSYKTQDVCESVRLAISKGCREIWLTSQDMSAYGRDTGTNLSELLESVTQIEGDFLVRVGMMNPLHFKKVELDKLIEVYKSDRIFKFLHLCVQSGSNQMLKTMRRGYEVEDFVSYLDSFRKEIPELTLSTDIIVGHPGEEEPDFQATVNLIKRIRPDVVNISKYGARPNTDAAKMKQINSKIASGRSKMLHSLVNNIKMENNKKWLGWEGRILVDENGTEEGTWMGRNYTYKPVVVKSSENLLGKFVKVKVVDTKSNYLRGELI